MSRLGGTNALQIQAMLGVWQPLLSVAAISNHGRFGFWSWSRPCRFCWSVSRTGLANPHWCKKMTERYPTRCYAAQSGDNKTPGHDNAATGWINMSMNDSTGNRQVAFTLRRCWNAWSRAQCTGSCTVQPLDHGNICHAFLTKKHYSKSTNSQLLLERFHQFTELGQLPASSSIPLGWSSNGGEFVWWWRGHCAEYEMRIDVAVGSSAPTSIT